MNEETARREMDYRIGENILLHMTLNGLLTEKEYEKLRNELLDICQPIVGELERGLLCQRRKSLK